MMKFITRLMLAVLLMFTVTIAGPAQASAQAQGQGWCTALRGGSPVADAIGDSLFEGGKVAIESQRWYGMLRDSFRTDMAPGFQIWTGGSIGGSATADYLPGAKYEGHIQFTVNQPNLIMLDWGTNDWAGGLDPNTFKAQYQQIISRIKFLAPNANILIVHQPWVYDPNITSTRQAQGPFKDAEQELAQENHLWFLDIAWFVPGDNRLNQYTDDLVHMNANGQGYQYTAIRSFLLGKCSQ